MATMSKIIVVSIRPRLKVLFTHALQAKASCLPLISWQFVIIQLTQGNRTVDPVLAFGRENVMYFFQVSMHGKDVLFTPLKNIEFGYAMLNFTWLNSRTLVVLDTTEQLHLLDVRAQEELEVIDMADVQLVYGSSHFKGLSTGGNVSRAMAVAGDRACYQSVTGFNGQVLLLGMKSVHLMTLRTWNERIHHLSKQHLYNEALQLAQSFFEDKGKAVVGLTGKKEDRTIIVGREMWKLLEGYIYHVCSHGGSLAEVGRGIEGLEDQLAEVIPTCIHHYLLLEEKFGELEQPGFHRPPSIPNFHDCLFGQVYEKFRSLPLARAIFLESLEPHVLNDRLSTVPLPPSVMHDFVEHYASKGSFQALEACVVHLNVASFDIHQVVTLCWNNGLYDAILYIYNKAMKDYTGPLVELLSVLQEAVQTGKQLTDLQISLGNKLMVYINCCLAGRAYPIGYIPEEEAYTVKEQVFKCLLSRHSANRKPNEPLYPHLRTLLHFDTREFLNVMALAFEEPEFNYNESIWKRQDVVDILLEVVHKGREFSPTQVGSLFTFLARQMAKHETTMVVNRSLFEQVLEYLTNTSEESRHEEREQALLELHSAGGLKYYDEERLLHQAEKAQFFRVCELLYEKRKEYHKIVSCYLHDPARKFQVFSFVRLVVESSDLSCNQKQLVEEEVVRYLEELIDVDNTEAARLLYDCLPKTVVQVVDKLENNPKSQFQFLKGFLQYRNGGGSNGTIGTPKEELELDPSILEKYTDLMCRFSPLEVYNFLKNNEDYRIEETLEIVKNHGIMDAAAYLLEKLGRAREAFDIMIENLDARIAEAMQFLLQGRVSVEGSLEIAWSGLQATLFILIQFCQRNSPRMSVNEREALWFQLLETIMAPQRKLHPDTLPEYVEAFKELTRHILNSMMGYIKMPSILEKILKDPTYNVSKFSEIRDLLMGMLDTYNYEKTLLSTTKNLLNSDLHTQLYLLHLAANKGFSSHSNACSLCNLNYERNVLSTGAKDGENQVVIFRCGHSYHSSCLHSVEQPDLENLICILCQRVKQKQPSLYRRISVREPASPGLASPSQLSSSNQQQPAAVASRTKVTLNSDQIQALEQLRKLHKTSQRLEMLAHLSQKEKPKRGYQQQQQSKTIFESEGFALRLAPPIMEKN